MTLRGQLMILPDFLGLGAQRAATTWVHECLREHPEVFVPRAKELHFFDAHFEKGIPWYADHFRACPTAKVKGEITATYLDNSVAVGRIAEVLPQAQLFVLLRNPIDRAISAYRFFRQDFRGLTFGEVCRTKRYLIDLGLYAKHLKTVFNRFPREQVKILLYDDVEHDPEAVLIELFRFLGVSDAFRPSSLRMVYNSASFPSLKNGLRAKLWALVRPFGSTYFGQWLRRSLSQQKRSWLERVSVEDRQYLARAFRDDVLQLQDMIGRDLSAWLTIREAALAEKLRTCLNEVDHTGTARPGAAL
jgi:hypothetical protein